MDETAKELEALLSAAKARERASRRKALIYTSVPIVIGVVFLATSLYQVSRLQRKSNELSVQIEKQKLELIANRDALETIDKERQVAEGSVAEAEAKLTLAKAALSDIDKGKGDPKQKARRTLQVLSANTSDRSNRQPSDLYASAQGFYQKVLQFYGAGVPSKTEQPVVVPNVIGKSYSDARAVLESVGLFPVTGGPTGRNRIVVRQRPDSGTRSSSKYVTLDFGDTLVPVLIPNVIGKSYSDARAALESVGLVPTTFDPIGENRTVVAQNPPPGTKSFSKYVELRLRIRSDSLSKPSPTATAQSLK